ncbi:MAG: hypothetical protein A2X49_07900 [Lentisphaerae bacterium GWF2_52_8]|nr:MAG: hypothetical protein A2X49_07900 [Lentisphaerae bacterium GWF2_52_8]
MSETSVSKEPFIPLWKNRIYRARLLLIAAGLVAVTAAAMRFHVNFSSLLPQEIDSAYYPLQARAILEEGHLAYHDLPLFFVLNALLAKFLILCAGMNMDSATLFASRFLDSILQPLTAFAIFGLGLAMVRELKIKTQSLQLALGLASAAVLATASQPIIGMAANFEKNSLGLLWLALAAWMLYEALLKGGWRHWILPGIVLMLAGITHVGALGATSVLIAGTLAAYLIIERKASLKKMGWGILTACLLGGGLLLFMYIVSPRRALTLLSAPLELFGSEQNFGPPGPGFHFGEPVWVFVYLIVGLGVWQLWKDRKDISSAQAALLIGVSIDALLLACPLVNGEYQRRLMLMSPIPAAIVLAFLAVRFSGSWKKLCFPLLLGVLSLASGIFGLFRGALPGPGGPPMIKGRQESITEKGAAELRSMRKLIENPSKTVVLSHMGLMWWTGFLMHVPVRESNVSAEDLRKYEKVYLLEDKNGFGPGHHTPPWVGTPDFHPQQGFPKKSERVRRGNPRDILATPFPTPLRNKKNIPGITEELSKTKLLYDGETYRLYELLKK